jgi:hypothetical protein
MIQKDDLMHSIVSSPAGETTGTREDAERQGQGTLKKIEDP